MRERNPGGFAGPQYRCEKAAARISLIRLRATKINFGAAFSFSIIGMRFNAINSGAVAPQDSAISAGSAYHAFYSHQKYITPL